VITKPHAVPQKNWQLGRHIQKIRKAKGITQEQLAEKIGTSTPWIGHIETGRELPNLKMLQKIARVLQVKVKELIPY
jgi:transcriptional regulator with XRE-family HTH domain